MSIKTIIPNFILSISIFCLSFFLAWQISATSDFLYSTWYEALKLDETIKKYSPYNKYKNGFENTKKQKHIELFSGIVDAIQNDGDGLRQLRYTNLKTNKTETLLTDAEVIHLQDVGRMISKIKYLGIFGLFVTSVVFVFMREKNIDISKFRYHLYGGVGTVFVLSLLVVLIGPIKIFYLGHELIFPNNHQWFFYYEESLMSTMMKAPVLFGPIACQLLLLSIIIWSVLLLITKHFLQINGKA